jgi:hypothetical protein
LSGPHFVISSYWRAGDGLRIDLAPSHALASELIAAKRRGAARLRLAELITPLADAWLPCMARRATPLWPRCATAISRR